MGLLELLYLYLCFRLKQLLCDYIQPGWVATGKHKALLGEGGRALSLHAGVHAFGTLLITLIFVPMLWWLAVVDFFVHGTIDRIKSYLVDRKKWSMDCIPFWFTFGLDQEAHNLTHLSYIIFIFMTLNPDLAF